MNENGDGIELDTEQNDTKIKIPNFFDTIDEKKLIPMGPQFKSIPIGDDAENIFEKINNELAIHSNVRKIKSRKRFYNYKDGDMISSNLSFDIFSLHQMRVWEDIAAKFNAEKDAKQISPMDLYNLFWSGRCILCGKNCPRNIFHDDCFYKYAELFTEFFRSLGKSNNLVNKYISKFISDLFFNRFWDDDKRIRAAKRLLK